MEWGHLNGLNINICIMQAAHGQHTTTRRLSLLALNRVELSLYSFWGGEIIDWVWSVSESDGNSRENQLNFFPLDLEKSFPISRSRLETREL